MSEPHTLWERCNRAEAERARLTAERDTALRDATQAWKKFDEERERRISTERDLSTARELLAFYHPTHEYPEFYICPACEFLGRLTSPPAGGAPLDPYDLCGVCLHAPHAVGACTECLCTVGRRVSPGVVSKPKKEEP